MENDPRYEFRTARDILADLLLNHLATTLPITDVPVLPEQPTVLYDNPAVITIPFSQPDVRYVVYDDTRTIMSEAVKGNGGELRIQTAHLTRQDYTFTVEATKTFSNNRRPLLQTATVKVGARLDLPVTSEKDFFDYNTTAAVIISGTQNGAIYQLFDSKDRPLSAGIDSGIGGDLRVETTTPLTDDVMVKVKVTNKKTELSGILEMQPLLKVAPNAGLTPRLKNPVIDYNGTATIVLENTQESVNYQLQFSTIDDDDPEKHLPPGTVISKTKKGNGKAIELTVDFPLQEDLTLTVLATKTDTGISKILDTSVLIPVRPDPDKTLSVVEETIDPAIGATIKVSQTQRGVMYQLRSAADETNIGRPEYHHKNYGIGKARLEIEFALDAFTAGSVYLPTGPLEKTTATFSVLAIKATTRQSAPVGTITVITKEKT